jgi:replicative DNA helicase
MWLSEDALSLSKYRSEMIASSILESNIEAFTKDLHIAGADSETIHFLEESRAGVTVSSKFYQFKRMLKNYDVIILDPLIAMIGADENNNAHARKFINLFTRWATKEKKTIIFIHHGTKNSSQSRGASAFVDAVRLVYRVEVIKNEKGEMQEDDMRWIILDKDNNGAKKYLGSGKVKRQVFPKKRNVIEIEYE